jgi:N-acetylglucosamine malate deacetylase 1
MRVLVVSPHADDETIAMGGTIARYAAEGHDVTVAVMTGHGDDEPHPLWPKITWEIIRAEARSAYEVLGVNEVIFEEIPAVRVSEQPLWKLNRITDRVVKAVRPRVIYVPFCYDMHKDHREIYHSFSVAWRPVTEEGRNVREVYCYETLSETHWNFPYVEPGFLPNVWVDVSDYLETKIRAMACFKSQIMPHPGPRSLEAVRSLARWRGSQMGMEAAESFVMVRRLI